MMEWSQQEVWNHYGQEMNNNETLLHVRLIAIRVVFEMMLETPDCSWLVST
jgi:hypothetical protein